jgi:hypothetical protein
MQILGQQICVGPRNSAYLTTAQVTLCCSSEPTLCSKVLENVVCLCVYIDSLLLEKQKREKRNEMQK